ncbi:hypothetical protein SUGI_0224720 [Cryptomeria japonica]|nr:hypothetical protein SUGI_0224720 [Cryptomeria japonica]
MWIRRIGAEPLRWVEVYLRTRMDLCLLNLGQFEEGFNRFETLGTLALEEGNPVDVTFGAISMGMDVV